MAASALAFCACLAGGLVVLIAVGISKKDAWGAGIGLYFIGKAFFVGPMLLITALQAGRE
jgi:hypothetical protein